jgi:hypothetical protein
LHQTAIAVYPVVKYFGRIVRPHNYKIEEQRKANSGDPAIKFQQKKSRINFKDNKSKPFKKWHSGM